MISIKKCPMIYFLIVAHAISAIDCTHRSSALMTYANGQSKIPAEFASVQYRSSMALPYSPAEYSPPEMMYHPSSGNVHSPPSDQQISFKFPLMTAFTGPLEPNNLLSSTRITRMFEGVIVGPTSLAIHGDFIYTGTTGGGVYRGNLRTGNATRIARIANEACESRTWDSSICGRPLGVRVDSSGTLFFVDAYLGLHVVEFVGNQVKLTRLLTVEDAGGKYMGHLVIDEGAGVNGGNVLYISLASTKRDLTQWTAMVIEPDRTGIVVRYDVDNGQYETIMTELWYPTSVEITDDRTAILVAEFSSRKVLKHYIKGPLKGKTEIWAENLPGESDHLIRSLDKTRETYWMPIVNARNVSSSNLLDWMSDKPWIRQEILDRYEDIGNAIEGLGQQFKNEQLERLGFSMKTGGQFYTQNVGNNYGLLLEMDANGKIIGSLHATDGTNSFLSEAVEGPSDNPSERVVYLGSFGYPYIGKLVIKKPIYELPILSADNDRPSGQYKTFAKPLSFDELKFVDIPTLINSWHSMAKGSSPNDNRNNIK